MAGGNGARMEVMGKQLEKGDVVKDRKVVGIDADAGTSLSRSAQGHGLLEGVPITIALVATGRVYTMHKRLPGDMWCQNG